jgi:tetratricopeptide (TPR) repeat protein
MNAFNLSTTILDEIQNHDDFQVVWLCSNNDVPSEFTPFFNDYLKKFHLFTTCDNYIKRFHSERKILLVLKDFFDHLSYFNDLPQIHSIYILDNFSQNVIYEKEKYSKLVHIFTDEHTLIDRVRRDILLTYRNDLPINISHLNEITIQQTLTSLDKTTLLFLWNQLFIYYLVNSPHVDMNKLKIDMIEQCQLEYKNDPPELPKIDQFNSDCTQDNVIQWYTKDSFVYRLVNRAFRTRNIDLICKFRYFIILLFNKLKQLSVEQQGENYKTVYRGQKMKINDLQTLVSNIGHLISTNACMSTSRDQNVAQIYLHSDDEVAVMFEINVRNTRNYIFYPFADISQSSTFLQEQEILFFPGAVFRIDSVEPEDDSTWIIKLSLSNETIEQIEQLLNLLRTNLTCTSFWEDLNRTTSDFKLYPKYYEMLTKKLYTWIDIITNGIGVNLYYLFSNLGNYKKCIEYYKKLLLNKNFIDYPKFIVLNIIIGNNYSSLFEYDNALLHYAIAYSLLDDKHRLTGELYNHIGDVWRATDSFENALSCYNEALEILISHCVTDRHIARIYRKISDVYRKQINYEVAIYYDKKADQLDISSREPSELNHERSLENYQNQLNTQLDLSPIQRADMLYSMGICLMKKGDFPQALEKLLQAKELYENGLPSYNLFVKKLGRLFETMALVYLLLKDNFNALAMWKRSIDVRSSFLAI